MDREPTARERAQAILAQTKAEHAAERRAAPLRAAAEIRRGKGKPFAGMNAKSSIASAAIRKRYNGRGPIRGGVRPGVLSFAVSGCVARHAWAR